LQAKDAPEEHEPLNENELPEIKVFKRKLTAYKKSFPNRFNWSALNSIKELEEQYNEVMITLNHNTAGMVVGVAYQMALCGAGRHSQDDRLSYFTGLVLLLLLLLPGWCQDNGNRSNQESKL